MKSVDYFLLFIVATMQWHKISQASTKMLVIQSKRYSSILVCNPLYFLDGEYIWVIKLQPLHDPRLAPWCYSSVLFVDHLLALVAQDGELALCTGQNF